MAKIADTTLGMNEQAAALLAALASIDLSEDVITGTDPFSNCRERGFVLTIRKDWRAVPHRLAFYEHRNSDELCCIHWLGKDQPISGGWRWTDIPEDVAPYKWSTTKTWPYMQLGPAIEYVASVVSEVAALPADAA